MTLEEFIVDVEAADTALRRLPTWQPMLRFPFLKEGDTAAKRDGMRAWMRSHAYRPAPVSIDTSDWYYNKVYLSLRNTGSAEKTRPATCGICASSARPCRVLRRPGAASDAAQPGHM